MYRRGEIVTILTVGTFVALIVSTIVGSFVTKNSQPSINSRAGTIEAYCSGIPNGGCSRLTVTDYYVCQTNGRWAFDTNNSSCYSTLNCTANGYLELTKANFPDLNDNKVMPCCSGRGNVDGTGRCKPKGQVAPPSSAVPQPTIPYCGQGLSCPIGWYCNGEYATGGYGTRRCTHTPTATNTPAPPTPEPTIPYCGQGLSCPIGWYCNGEYIPGGYGMRHCTHNIPPTATPTPQPTVTPIPTATPRPTLTPTPKPTITPVPTVTLVPTTTPRPTATPQPTVTRIPTATPRPTLTPTPKPTMTPVPTVTLVPTITPIPFQH